ncbi:hypothetical protein [Streptomyces halobius]|uniref:Uncharacterized protein n=1 Tax=Streptomyces halobius TaxID=2879846 RepID=A0ABY4M3J9_9ACTN|nr:hypothetical protein [Streptomyces halobius]UQA92032.1 hypothetical protein K9S39_09380 [Streptomyces halobius]
MTPHRRVHRRARVIGAVIAALITVVAAAVLPGPALAALPSSASAAPKAKTERVETVVKDPTIPDTVEETYVKLRVPMGGAPHPEACDWIGYLRFRAKSGPRDSKAADAVMTSMPGFTGGAAMLTQNGAQTVDKALAKGKHVEYWAMDRRANCLEDHRGLDAANRTHNPDVAIDYYWHGKEVDGHKFAGWPSDKQLGVLGDIGLARTMDDWHALISEAGLNPRRTLCGGHSMGGPLTAMFASWDFNGTPGWSLCRGGYFSIDTFISTDPLALRSFPFLKQVLDTLGGPTLGTLNAVIKNGPRSLGFTQIMSPKVFATVALLGLAARYDGNRETDVYKRLPKDDQVDLALRLTSSRTYGQFLSGKPQLRDFRFTGEAALGVMLNRASQPLGLLQLGLGTLDGGPVGQKYFPVPGQLGHIPFLGDLLANTAGLVNQYAPTDTKKLYRWRNYDQVGAPDAPKQVDDLGKPYVTPGKVVTDIKQLAVSLSSPGPADVDEWYFPTRLAVEWGLALAGVRSGDLAHLKHEDGPKRNPQVSAIAEESPIKYWQLIGLVPKDAVLARGYHHIDMAAAAARQNNGKPEIVSKTFADFVVKRSG